MATPESVLTGFTAQTFQDLAAAIVLSEVGGRAQKMGGGPDGGRDLILRNPANSHAWAGYTVFQAKFKTDPSERNVKNVAWLSNEVRKEIRHWLDPSGRRAEVPHRFVIITNVPLSPSPRTGGVDQIRDIFMDGPQRVAGEMQRRLAQNESLTKRQVQEATSDLDGRRRRLEAAEWLVWDANQLTGLLDKHPSVRTSFPALWTVGDAFVSLSDYFETVAPQSVGEALRAHARSAFTGNSEIYFDEAGDSGGNGYPLHDIVIDLPLRDRSESLLSFALGRAEHVLRPSITSIDGPRHIVVSGAPGNGKTTISRYLIHAIRSVFLSQGIALSRHQAELQESAGSSLKRLGLTVPAMPRWPMYVDLAAFAESVAKNESETLLKWISTRISRDSDRGKFTASQLKDWVSNWPTILVLDGLDEVPLSSVRRAVISRIVELAEDSEADDADLLIIVTTRPTGYVEKISPHQFEQVDLEFLDPERAVSFGVSVSRFRLRGDSERRERVGRRLRLAVGNPQLIHLLRTPLQVLMMTIISESEDVYELDRYGLFSTYFETTFKRERAKSGAIGSLIRRYGAMVVALHEFAGLELHRRSERLGIESAAIGISELREMARRVVETASLDPVLLDSEVVDSLVSAVLHRLVLLAPRDGGGFGFDVRSLQELMAARCVTGVDEAIAHENLRAMCASPHWRNVVLFSAAIMLRSNVWEARDRFVAFLVSLDSGAEYRLGHSVPIVPTLAMQILEDGNCRDEARWRDPLAVVAMNVFSHPGSRIVSSVWDSLRSVVNNSPPVANFVEDRMDKALGGSPVERRNVEVFRESLYASAAEGRVSEVIMGLRGWKPAPGAVSSPVDHWPSVRRSMSESTSKIEREAVSLIDQLRSRGRWSPSESKSFLALLEDTTNVASLDAALSMIATDSLMIGQAFRDAIEEGVHRAPVGQLLRHRLS